jgi:hypothetical protein
VLKLGLESKDSEVRFYAAEALAYLDEPCCVPLLAEAAKNEPAFRAYALTALSALNDIHSSDALRDLFDVASAETRYGAFRALWAMNEHDPQLHGEKLSDKFWLHVVPSEGPNMVHVAHSQRPEIVVLGEGQQFKLPMTVEAGNTIVVKSQDDGQISVVKLSATAADKRTLVENSIEAVIRGIAEVGGDYPDVVQALQQARANGSLTSRFEVDALPERGRLYDRNRRLARADRPVQIGPEQRQAPPATMKPWQTSTLKPLPRNRRKAAKPPTMSRRNRVTHCPICLGAARQSSTKGSPRRPRKAVWTKRKSQ